MMTAYGGKSGQWASYSNYMYGSRATLPRVGLWSGAIINLVWSPLSIQSVYVGMGSYDKLPSPLDHPLCQYLKCSFGIAVWQDS